MTADRPAQDLIDRTTLKLTVFAAADGNAYLDEQFVQSLIDAAPPTRRAEGRVGGLPTVETIAGALKGTYAAEFPKADDADWLADAEFVLARFQEATLQGEGT